MTYFLAACTGLLTWHVLGAEWRGNWRRERPYLADAARSVVVALVVALIGWGLSASVAKAHDALPSDRSMC